MMLKLNFFLLLCVVMPEKCKMDRLVSGTTIPIPSGSLLAALIYSQNEDLRQGRTRERPHLKMDSRPDSATYCLIVRKSLSH